MLKRLLISTVLGGVALYVWGMISWMMLPFHGSDVKQIPEPEQVISVLSEHLTEAGVYYYPGHDPNLPQDQAMAIAREQGLKGPNITTMVYYPGGFDWMAPGTFVKSFIVNLVAALAIVMLIARSQDAIPTVMDKLRFSWWVAIGVMFLTLIPQIVWFRYPVGYIAASMLDVWVSATLVALICAWQFRPNA